MTEIDYALAWTFVDDDGTPRQLRFRLNYAPAGDHRTFDGTGQLIAAIADATRPDNHHEIAISRPGVTEEQINAALDGWEDWALLHAQNHGIDRWISLPAIRRRVNDAGLGIESG